MPTASRVAMTPEVRAALQRLPVRRGRWMLGLAIDRGATFRFTLPVLR